MTIFGQAGDSSEGRGEGGGEGLPRGRGARGEASISLPPSRGKEQQARMKPFLLVLLQLLLPGLASAARPKFSWDTVPAFIHCSNASGGLNNVALKAMAQTGYSVIEKFQCLSCAPEKTGAEEKILAAAAGIRELNPNAAVFLYYQVDLARTWYDGGAFFDSRT